MGHKPGGCLLAYFFISLNTLPIMQFKHNDQTIRLNYTYFEAMNTFPDLGLDILGIVTDATPIIQIMADDKTMIKIWYHFVKDMEPDFEEALRSLKPAEMQQFKEAFWESVVNFSSPPTHKTLRQMWDQVKEELKRPKNLFKNTSLDSQVEQE